MRTRHNHTLQFATLVAALALIATGCSGGDSSADNAAANAPSKTSANVVAKGNVEGTVNGTRVTMAHADFDGQLAIYEGDGWGFSPSLLIFLFLDNNESPAGQTFVVRRGENGMHPHVHYRWRVTDEDGEEKLDVDSVMNEYEMTLTLGEIEDDELPGTISFSRPGEDTKVSGEFRAKIKN